MSPLQTMSASDVFVYVGVLDPDALQLTVEPSVTLPDLTVVTSVDVLPFFNSVALAPWAIDAITVQTTTMLRGYHLWRANDTSAKRLGLHTLVVRLYVGSVLRRCLPKRFFVRPLEA